MNEPKQQMFNLKDYEKWKEAGSVHLQKIGQNSIFLVKDKYDTDTGKSTDPVFIPVTEEKLNELKSQNLKAIEDIQAQNNIIDILINDLKEVR